MNWNNMQIQSMTAEGAYDLFSVPLVTAVNKADAVLMNTEVKEK